MEREALTAERRRFQQSKGDKKDLRKAVSTRGDMNLNICNSVVWDI